MLLLGGSLTGWRKQACTGTGQRAAWDTEGPGAPRLSGIPEPAEGPRLPGDRGSSVSPPGLGPERPGPEKEDVCLGRDPYLRPVRQDGHGRPKSASQENPRKRVFPLGPWSKVCEAGRRREAGYPGGWQKKKVFRARGAGAGPQGAPGCMRQVLLRASEHDRGGGKREDRWRSRREAGRPRGETEGVSKDVVRRARTFRASAESGLEPGHGEHAVSLAMKGRRV